MLDGGMLMIKKINKDHRNAGRKYHLLFVTGPVL